MENQNLCVLRHSGHPIPHRVSGPTDYSLNSNDMRVSGAQGGAHLCVLSAPRGAGQVPSLLRGSLTWNKGLGHLTLVKEGQRQDQVGFYFLDVLTVSSNSTYCVSVCGAPIYTQHPL